MAVSLAARDASFRRLQSNKMNKVQTKTILEQNTKKSTAHHPHSALMQQTSDKQLSGLRQRSWRSEELERSAAREKLEHSFAAKRKEAESRIRLRREMVEKKNKKRQIMVGSKQGCKLKNFVSSRDTMMKHIEVFVKSLEKTANVTATSAKFGAKLLLGRFPDMEEPLHLTCPITLQLFEDPVITPSGHSYSKLAIKKYINMYNRCPMTREPLNDSMLIPNRCLADAVLNHKLLFLSD
jgi:hypothetical protein